jgi:hypothetical protein
MQRFGLGESNMDEMTEPAALIGFNNNLFERMRDMHRSWLKKLREIRQIEAEFGTRLLTAKSPSEATAICSEWMTKRLETVACEQQAFAVAWLALISDATKATPAMTAGAPGQDQTIACR